MLGEVAVLVKFISALKKRGKYAGKTKVAVKANQRANQRR